MRNHTILMGLALTLSLMISMAFVLANTNKVIEAHVWIHPQRLTIDEHEWPLHSPWVTAFIQLPKNYSARNIDPASITLQVNGGTVQASNRHAILGRIYVAKFDRAEVNDLLRTLIGHMMPHPMQKVTLVIMGNLRDGTIFRGEDTINVFFEDN